MAILTAKQTWRRNPEPGWARRSSFLTPTERDNVRRAVAYLCGRYPTNAARMAALNLTRDQLAKARSTSRAQSYRLACAIARVAGVPVESRDAAKTFVRSLRDAVRLNEGTVAQGWRQRGYYRRNHQGARHERPRPAGV